MSLFKKPTRKFRQRITYQDSDEEANIEKDASKIIKSEPMEIDGNHGRAVKISLGHNEEQREIKTTFKVENDEPSNTKKTSGSKLLSFHEEEEEEEVFKVKKSNYSRRLVKQREKERKKGTLISSNDKKPEKTFEDETILKTDTPPPRIDNPNEPTIIVKPLSIPKPKNKPNQAGTILNGEEAEDIGSDYDDEEDDAHKFNPFKNALKSGIIPDAATIFAMKKHRQMAREMGDFIPVDDTQRLDEDKSRLVRDDDNDRSDEEEEGRINFSVNVAEVERQKAREAFLSAQNQSVENEEADELDNWEREQIRKGVGIVQMPSSQKTDSVTGLFNLAPSNNSNSPGPYLASYETVKHAQIKASGGQTMVKDKSNLTTQSIKNRLQEKLSSLQEVHRAHKLQYDSYKEELISTYDTIEKLTKEGPILSKQFAFYQEMRAYVEDLTECMDIKLGKVALLEQRLMALHKSRVEKLVARRQQDVKDQAEEYSIIANKVMRGLPTDFIEDKPVYSEVRSRRVAEREGRRMRRRKLREAESAGRVAHNEGMSSDDEESESDLIAFRQEYEAILAEAQSVFADVVEEFGSLEGVKVVFLKWKEQALQSYKDAYVSICLPKVFNAFIRLELLNWNPLESRQGLQNMFWYRTLVFYGWDADCDSWTEMEKDPDTNLLPDIINKIVLPHMTSIVQNAWDPLSTKQTLKLVKTVTKLIQDNPSVDGTSKRLQDFFKTVVTRFQVSLEDDIFIPLYPKQLLDNRTSTVSVFFSRQFWTCVKLLRNILTWHGLLAEAPLLELSLGCLLNRYINLALQSFPPSKSVVEKCKTISNTFPRAWFSGNKIIPQLDMFQRFLVQLAGRCKTAEEGENANWCIREIIQMLHTVGAADKANNLSKEYNIFPDNRFT